MINPNARFTVSSHPYNHLIVEDFFDEGTAFALGAFCNDVIVDGRPVGKVGESGNLVYDALCVTPKVEQLRQTAVGALVSAEVRNLMVEAFDIHLDENMMIGIHRHHPPSKDGWPHTDFSVVSFPDSPPNFGPYRIYAEDSGCQYADDSKDRQPEAIKTARAVACIYFTANERWAPGMGGETAIIGPDGVAVHGLVPPKNNLLFAFEISPYSYHAYRGSTAMQRSSFIWWYHAKPGYLEKRHAAACAARRAEARDPWDRWTAADVEKYPVPAYP